MGRSPCCSKEGLNRGAWTAMEDKTLTDYINIHGEGNWRNLPKKAGLKRCGKSCRLRWLNYLRPGIKRGNITNDEEELIIRLHKLLGNRWSLIAGRLPGRTDNEIKNYWNTIIGKKLQNHQQTIQSVASSIKKPIAQPQLENSNPTIDQKYKSLQPGVVRTKASRCNKVVITPNPPKNDALAQHVDDTKPLAAPVPPSLLHARVHDDGSLQKTESSMPQFHSDENNSSNLMVDFEMDEQLLSDFLNTDFSQLNNFGNGSTSDRTLLVPDDALHDSNFSLIDSLIESEFDWIID